MEMVRSPASLAQLMSSRFKKIKWQADMIVYAFSPSILEAEAGEFEASLVYTASFRQLELH